MDAGIIVAVVTSTLSALSLICVALINFYATKDKKREQLLQQQRDARDEERQELLLQLLRGNRIAIDFGYANAMALKNGRTNGELSKVLIDYEKFEEDMENSIEQKQVSAFTGGGVTQTQTVTIQDRKLSIPKAFILGFIIFVVAVFGTLLINRAISERTYFEQRELMKESILIEEGLVDEE